MISYTKAAMERAMKVQEVILRAIAKRITSVGSHSKLTVHSRAAPVHHPCTTARA
jgi:hypothetical protein